MPQTNEITITNSGITAIASAISGEELLFTKIIIGQGTLAGQDPKTMTDVIEPIEVLPITKGAKGDDGRTFIVGADFNNNDRADGFYLREIGLYGNTETTGEVLIAYVNAGDNAEYIPAGAGAKAVEKSIDIVIITGAAENVSALIDSNAFARKAEVEAARTVADEALEKANEAKEEIQNIDPCPPEGCPALQALAARVARLEQALYDELNSNPFEINFNTLAHKTVTAGNWNVAQARLEC